LIDAIILLVLVIVLLAVFVITVLILTGTPVIVNTIMNRDVKFIFVCAVFE